LNKNYESKKYHITLDRFKLKLISKLINNKISFWILVIGGPFSSCLLVDNIKYLINIVYRSQIWMTSKRNLLKRKHSNLFLQKVLLSGSKNYLNNLIRDINRQHLENLYIVFKSNQWIIIVVDISYKEEVESKLTNIVYIIEDSNSIDNSFRNLFGNNVILTIIWIGIINSKNSLLILGIIILRCLYSHCQVRKLEVT
jgi:hypothetical protein